MQQIYWIQVYWSYQLLFKLLSHLLYNPNPKGVVNSSLMYETDNRKQNWVEMRELQRLAFVDSRGARTNA